MIHVGDIMRKPSSGSVGIVTTASDVAFIVDWGIERPVTSVGAQAFADTEYAEGHVWELYHCPHTIPAPQPTADLDPHDLTYCYNEGVLIGLVEQIHFDANQALGFYDSDTLGRQADYLEGIVASIKHAAALLKPHPRPDGTHQESSLVTMLSAVRPQPNTPKEN